jgi:hypothetical protein
MAGHTGMNQTFAAMSLLCLMAAAPAAGGMIPISQERSVRAVVSYPGGFVARQQEAPDFGPFNALVVADYDSAINPGNFIATAGQESSIAADRLLVEGFIEITNPFEVIESVVIQAGSVYKVRFEVTEPLNFVLDGSITGQWDTGGTNINNGSFAVAFDGPGGMLFDSGGSTPAGVPGGLINIPFVAAGVLMPGLYQVDLAFLDNLGAYGAPDQPGFGGGGYVEYKLDLQIVPEPCTVGLLSGCLFWIARKPVRSKSSRRLSQSLE